jgi:hypothetical protein
MKIFQRINCKVLRKKRLMNPTQLIRARFVLLFIQRKDILINIGIDASHVILLKTLEFAQSAF